MQGTQGLRRGDPAELLPGPRTGLTAVGNRVQGVGVRYSCRGLDLASDSRVMVRVVEAHARYPVLTWLAYPFFVVGCTSISWRTENRARMAWENEHVKETTCTRRWLTRRTQPGPIDRAKLSDALGGGSMTALPIVETHQRRYLGRSYTTSTGSSWMASTI